MRWWPRLHQLLPWAPRADRLAAIEHARAQKEQSLRDLEHAQSVTGEIEDAAHANHYASWIAGQIIEGRLGHGNGGG